MSRKASGGSCSITLRFSTAPSQKSGRKVRPGIFVEEIQKSSLVVWQSPEMEDAEADNLENITSYTSQHLEKTIRQIVELLNSEAIEIVAINEMSIADEDKKERIKQLRETLEKKSGRFIAQRLGIIHGGSSADYDLKNLLSNYNKTLPAVQTAKQSYKRNVISGQPEAHVKVDVSKLRDEEVRDIPDEFILRLAGNLAGLSKQIRKSLTLQGGTSKPSDIALEWAARLCGCPDYHYTLSHLQKILGKQKQIYSANEFFPEGDAL